MWGKMYHELQRKAMHFGLKLFIYYMQMQWIAVGETEMLAELCWDNSIERIELSFKKSIKEWFFFFFIPTVSGNW